MNEKAESSEMRDRALDGDLRDLGELAEVCVGVPLPLGTHQRGDGVNFALFSRHATRVRLALFDHLEDQDPTKIIPLDPAHHRTGAGQRAVP